MGWKEINNVPTKKFEELADMGLTYREIAEKLECDISTVYDRLRKIGRTPPGLPKGRKNPKWAGDVYHTAEGYVYVYAPDHPRAKNSRVAEHILNWEKANDRPLPKGWLVHHINNVKSDNRPENLQAMPISQHNSTLLLLETQERLRELQEETSTKISELWDTIHNRIWHRIDMLNWKVNFLMLLVIALLTVVLIK